MFRTQAWKLEFSSRASCEASLRTSFWKLVADLSLLQPWHAMWHAEVDKIELLMTWDTFL